SADLRYETCAEFAADLGRALGLLPGQAGVVQPTAVAGGKPHAATELAMPVAMPEPTQAVTPAQVVAAATPSPSPPPMVTPRPQPPRPQHPPGPPAAPDGGGRPAGAGHAAAATSRARAGHPEAPPRQVRLARPAGGSAHAQSHPPAERPLPADAGEFPAAGHL